MKIAFLGKGGSGKSTLATALVRYVHKKGIRALAIDADHNMDLSFNLGGSESLPHLGSDPYRIKEHIGVDPDTSYAETFEYAQKRGITYRISPPDSFTAHVTTELQKDLLLMTAGPHTDIVRSGKHCSHSLAAPLKVFLPLLQLGENEAVVIDERAGTDPVATGILKSVDLAVIVTEPTVHSIRVSQQIAHELDLAQVPYIFVANKIRNDEDAKAVESLGTPVIAIPFGMSGDVEHDVIQKIVDAVSL